MLAEKGFSIVSGPFEGDGLNSILDAHDRAIAAARLEETRIGSTSTRVDGLLDHAPELSAIFTHPPLLAAAAALIGGAFKLSAFHSRSLRPGAEAEPLHQDVAPGRDGWPLVGFIFMIDPFSVENGATRFLPASAGLASLPETPTPARLCHACGPAGAMIVFDGSVWHGHGANMSGLWRRSVQGALIPKAATAAMDHRRRLRPEAWAALPREARMAIEP